MRSTFTEGFTWNSKMAIPELPKNKCVLDFSKSEIEILHEISKLIQSEQIELEKEINRHQCLIMNGGKDIPKETNEQIEEPTSKELFEFKSRLEVRLIDISWTIFSFLLCSNLFANMY